MAVTPLLTCAATLALGALLSAQEPTARVEIGAQFSALGLPGAGSTGGAGGRVTVALTPRVSIDTRVTLFPADLPPAFLSQGGKTLEAFAGARGKFVARRRFSFYGVVLPGLLHFSNTAIGQDGESLVVGRVTHFALDMGFGVELHPARRWIAHAEMTGPLYAVGGKELARSEPSATSAVLVLAVPSSIVSSWQFNTGLAYRIGALGGGPEAQPADHRWTVGPLFSYTAYVPAPADDLIRAPGIGAFASYRITSWLHADGAFDTQVKQENVHSPFSGGRVARILGGVKIGPARGRLGYFLKVRAGVQHHGAALKATRAGTTPPVFGSARTIALDLGGVVEAYLSRRLLLRVDAGDLMSFNRTATILDRGQPVRQPAPAATDGINVSVGFGWRLPR